MNEVKTSEITEVKQQPYQEIKPKTDLSADAAKKFWDKQFDPESSPKDKPANSEIINQDTVEDEEYPKVVYEDGHNNYYDDNGNLYKTDKDLKPNCEYTINGYDYKTDVQGRIIEASGKLRLKERNNYKQIKDSLHDIGKGDERPESDEKGHLIGDQFDGKNRLENAVAMDGKLNKGDYERLENSLAKRVSASDDVRVKVEPIYEANSNRPSAISYTYTINGEQSVQIFPNGKE